MLSLKILNEQQLYLIMRIKDSEITQYCLPSVVICCVLNSKYSLAWYKHFYINLTIILYLLLCKRVKLLSYFTIAPKLLAEHNRRQSV